MAEILEQIKNLIKGDANRDGLFAVLKATSPDLTLDQILNEDGRNRAVKKLQLRIHPDKHGGSDVATKLFQDVQVFIDIASKRLHVTTPKPFTPKPSTPKPSNSHTFHRASTMPSPDSDYPNYYKSDYTNDQKKSEPVRKQDNSRNARARSKSRNQREQAPEVPVSKSTTNKTSSTSKEKTPAKTPSKTSKPLKINGTSLNDESFRVQDKWTAIDDLKYSEFNIKSERDLIAHISCSCINTRGTIAHGRKINLRLDGKKYVTSSEKKFSSVEDFFKSVGGGVKKLKGANDIKKELFLNGPVVSTSFKLDADFLKKIQNNTQFAVLASLVGKNHPLMIEGWGKTSRGQVWIVAPFQHNEKRTFIPMNFAKIDNCCLAPKSNFEDMTWEKGPYFDHPSGKSEAWTTIGSAKFSAATAELEMLGNCFNCGIFEAINKKKKFTLRNSLKKAHSRACVLKDIEWKGDKSKWEIFVEFI
eukprot:CAMPEP_0194368206 /NCGR_PEP_ID=MMETSP0174-20130528/16449_1 /TAXON_ID=216777 /ORGANISM="Proboscia alata, Strain PI-D3" /LENGTH=472 /DNA_ID=CAMNT_0039144463 /DNA_START=55 /DNA_END=1473 /DNA_ORIENTATION=+